jgi:RNA polymerase subunit RPABC4/transcription elongation factor Spt4
VVPKVYAPTEPDLHGVRKTAGDYNQADLEAAMSIPQITGDIVEHWLRLAKGRRTVCFASGVKHSKELTEAFLAAGVPAVHVDGSMLTAERDAALGKLATGEALIACNCDVITEGYDLPILSCAILARPTESSGKYRQMVGRIMRSLDGKTDAIVLDHAGCTLRHGFVQSPVEYSLADTKPPRGASGVKVCKVCFGVMPANLSICPLCGQTQPRLAPVAQRPRKVRTADGRLVELTPGQARDACPNCGGRDIHRWCSPTTPMRACCRCNDCNQIWFAPDPEAIRHATRSDKRREWQRLVAIAEQKGYKRGWASHKYRALFGVWPVGVQDDP